MTEFLLLALKLCVVAMVVAIGMSSRPGELAYLWQRPWLLVRSLLAMYLLVPMAAFAIAKLLPVSPAAKAILLVLSVSAGAPLLPRKLLFIGEGAYIFGLAVISSLLAIVVAPAWVALLARHFGVAAELPALRVAEVIAKGFLLPLGIGLIAHVIWPAASERISGRVLSIAGAVLLASGLALLALHFRLFMQVAWGGVGALGALMLVALAIGHALGGPHEDDRTALAVACATRHIGIALLVATTFPGPRTAVLVIGYLLAMVVVTAPYLRWRKRRTTSRCASPDG